MADEYLEEGSGDFPTEVPQDLEAGLRQIKEVDDYLKRNGASGILIGGRAYAIMAGSHPLEIERRKDTDVLVVKGGEMLPHSSPYDLFIPDATGAFKNRHNFTLPFHIHYMREDLQPGIHIPPAQIVFLTENEMATRRAIDRVVPDVIAHRFQAAASQFSQLSLDDIVLEFPGDFSWFGKIRFSFPVQLTIRDTPEGGRRNFLSFRQRSPSLLPGTAFPSENDVRAPETNALQYFPAVELSPDEIKEHAVSLIKAGYVKEGMEYILKNAPEQADSEELVADVLSHTSKFPIQVCEAMGMWLRAAQENDFTFIALASGYAKKYYGIDHIEIDRSRVFFDIKTPLSFRALAESIRSNYGIRYGDLPERVGKVSCSSFVSPETSFIDRIDPQHLKKRLLSFFPDQFDAETRTTRSKWNEISNITGKGGEKFPIVMSLRPYLSTEGDLMFNETYYKLCAHVGIETKDIVAAIKERDGVYNYFKYGIFRRDSDMSFFSKRPAQDWKQTGIEIMMEIFQHTNQSPIPDLADFILGYGVIYPYDDFCMATIVKICGAKDLEALKKALKKIAGTDKDKKAKIDKYFSIAEAISLSS